MPKIRENVAIPIVSIKWADFEPQLGELSLDLQENSYSVLCGLNNSGKSAILKGLNTAYYAKKPLYMGVQRFVNQVNVDHARTQPIGQSRAANVDYVNSYNIDGVHYSVEHLLLEWGDARRDAALAACADILGEEFTFELSDPNNRASSLVLKIGGQDVKYASSGARLVLRLVLEAFSEIIDILLIDEPELGLAPVIQQKLYHFLADRETRQRLIPHIKSIIVATHSHHFLNKNNVTCNYKVTKNGRSIRCTPIESVQELNQLQIDLLGNHLDTYLLPAAIIIVEGKTDLKFIERVVALKYPNRNVIVVGSEDGLIRRLRGFNQMIGGTRETPYYSRTFVIMDSVHHGVTTDQVKEAGADPKNVIEWDNNGIEYVYPAAIIQEAFRCDEAAVKSAKIDNSDEITINGITKRKKDLVDFVVMRLQAETIYPLEMHQKLFEKLDRVLG